MAPRPLEQATPPSRGAERAPGWLGALIVGLVAFAIYLPTLRAGFVWDDHFIVTANQQIRSLTDLPALLGSHAFSGAGEALGSERVVEYYRPVWTASLAVDHAIWGLRPFGYHLTNLLLHAAASVAVFLLIRALLGGLLAPLVAGLLFALHPAHVEAVAWVSSRNELLAGLFVALALIAYVRLRDAEGAAGAGRASSAGATSHRPRAAILCLACAALALLSKETAVTLPLLAAAIELLPGRGTAWRRARWPLALAALTVGFLILRAMLVHGHPDPHPLAQRMFTAPRLLVESLRIAVLPVGLRVFHDVAIVTSATPAFWIQLLLLALWIGMALALRSRLPGVFLGMAWALIALLPVSGLVVMLQPALLAERYLYLPTIGVGLAGGALLALAERRRPSLGPVLFGIAVVPLSWFGMATARQSRLWESDLTLMSAMVDDAPNAVTGHANLGVVLEREGRLAEARTEYQRAVELAPSDHLQHSNLAGVLGKLGHPADAEREFRAALGLKPDDADALYGLGWLDSRAERWEDARKELVAAIRVRPGSAASHSALGNVLLNLGRTEEALVESREAVRLGPDLPEAHYGLALGLGQLGRFAEAAEEFRRTVALKPDWAEAHFDLGATLARLDRAADARAEFETALRLAPPGSELRALAADALRQVGTH